MRIISGRFRGKRLVSPPDALTTRPIPDRVKESLFNLLRGHFEGARVVDLFAGTGSIGLETASRGAERVVLVEKDKKIARVLDRNVEAMGRPAGVEVLIADALSPGVVGRCPAPITLLFADPPYPLVRDPEGWSRFGAQFARLIERMTPDGFAVARTPWPFLHATAPMRAERAPKRSAVIDLDSADDAAIDEIEAEWAAAVAGDRFRDVDLSIRGAVGPETHVYGSMAVHLYMRAGAGDA